MTVYRWNQTPLAGPRSFVMSHDQAWLGASATSSGLVRAGWVAWLRRSPVWPAARRIRYMVDSEHHQRPSSSSRAHTCAGARSCVGGQ
jgi:hypothetical protein